MNKEFIPYEQALALKELGFDEECLTSYHYDGTLMDIWSAMRFVTNSSLKDPKNFNAYSNSKLLKDYLDNPFTAAPTFSQTFRWFREKDYYSEVRVGCTQIDGGIGYEWWVWKPNGIEEWSIQMPGEEWSYETYEEAEQACLDKLIEIIKKDAHI